MMGRAYDPWAGTDFAQGGMPRGNEEPPSPTLSLPPHPPLSDNPRDNARVMQNYLDSLNASLQLVDKSVVDPVSGQTWVTAQGGLDPRQKEVVDQVQAEVNFWLTQSAKQESEQATLLRGRESDISAEKRSNISAGATLGAAGISAGASRFTAEETTRRQEAADIRAAEESGRERTFKAGETAATRAGNVEVTTLSNKLAGEREAAQRTFDAEQKAMDREIQRIQLDIAQGNLNLNSALGQLEKWLEAQKYTLPEGAEYVPGFQPGGAVQESARLAGVGYNPANYRANTVPFDPHALVRQTMGR